MLCCAYKYPTILLALEVTGVEERVSRESGLTVTARVKGADPEDTGARGELSGWVDFESAAARKTKGAGGLYSQS